jgi:hypothetical protein
MRGPPAEEVMACLASSFCSYSAQGPSVESGPISEYQLVEPVPIRNRVPLGTIDRDEGQRTNGARRCLPFLNPSPASRIQNFPDPVENDDHCYFEHGIYV